MTPFRVDFDDLGSRAEEWVGDRVFLCLGTTMRKAGSREAFRTVDLHYTVAAARLAVEHGARDAFLVSSVGADPAARSFYLRTKGEAEEAVAALPFRSVHLVRPSVLTGHRAESRPLERIAGWVGGLLGPLMVGPARRYRPVAAARVAGAMAALASAPGVGRHVHESPEISALARRVG